MHRVWHLFAVICITASLGITAFAQVENLNTSISWLDTIQQTGTRTYDDRKIIVRDPEELLWSDRLDRTLSGFWFVFPSLTQKKSDHPLLWHFDEGTGNGIWPPKKNKYPVLDETLIQHKDSRAQERWKHSPDNPRSVKESLVILAQCRNGYYYSANTLWETCVYLKLITPEELGTTQSRLEWYNREYHRQEAIRIRNALERNDPRTLPSELDPYVYLGRLTLADLDISPEQAKKWGVHDAVLPTSTQKAGNKIHLGNELYGPTGSDGFFGIIRIPQRTIRP